MAAGVFGGLIAAVYYRYEHARQRVEAAKYDAERARQEIENRCVGSPDAVARAECLIQEMRATQEQKRSEYDLRAQQEMAEWGFAMFLATCFGVAFTGAGVWLIALTLGETRRTALYAARTLRESKRATAAAVATVNVTREIGAAQSQAYLVIQAAYFQFVLDRIKQDDGSERERLTLAVAICVKNTGQTPAHSIRYSINGRIALDEERVEEIREIRYISSEYKAIGAGEVALDEFNLGDAGLGAEFLGAIITEQPGVTIQVRCQHDTVFEGREYRTPGQRFILAYKWVGIGSHFFDQHEMIRIG